MRKTISLRMLQTTIFNCVLFASFMILSSFTTTTNDIEDWTLITSENNLEVYGQITNCEDGEYYLFKFKNTSDFNKRLEVIITIPNEPAYGSQTFEESVLAKSETSSECSEIDVRLPKMAKDADLTKVQIKLTSK